MKMSEFRIKKITGEDLLPKKALWDYHTGYLGVHLEGLVKLLCPHEVVPLRLQPLCLLLLSR
jgi:hypothetical protein